MTYQEILLHITDGVARLTLNRPDKLNSFTVTMHEELQHALGVIEAVSGLRVLLLTGAGRGFCAGQDLAEFAGVFAQGVVDLSVPVAKYYAPLVSRLRALPAPVLCAVNGVAAGAGANLVLAADIVIAKKSASFLQPFCKLGLLPDTGGTYFLPRLLGTARAMGLAMLAEPLTAEQAADWGLIWKCIDDETFERETEKLLQQLAGAATLSLALTKRAMYAGATATLEEQLVREGAGMKTLGNSEDFREGVMAFAGRRATVFRGR